MRRYAAKIDESQPAIVDALTKAGATVAHIREPIDLAIGWRGETIMAEVKTRDGKFKRSQVQFFKTWRGGLAVVLTDASDVSILMDPKRRESLRPTPEQLARVRE